MNTYNDRFVMECNVREISNAIMIDSLNSIIEQESWKLELDKNTGLLAKKLKTLKIKQALKKNEDMATQNNTILNDLRKKSPQVCTSFDRVDEIGSSANVFTKSPSFFTTNNHNNSIDVKYEQVLKKKVAQTHIELQESGDHKVIQSNENNKDCISPDSKVRRNVRFGEYSPLNPANQVNSQPFIGIGEYDIKKKKLLELQRKEYLEYLSKKKKERKNFDLPKLPAYSCEEAFKTAMEGNLSKEVKLDSNLSQNHTMQLAMAPLVEEIETCAFDQEQIKETNRLKQELYRFELRKQIEEKKKIDLERKCKEQIEDEAIERAARDQEDKVKKEIEKETEKRTLALLQKQLQQEKLKNEIMQKQKDLENNSLNITTEMISQQMSKHNSSTHLESFENNDFEEFRCPPQSPFDNVPLPTSRVRVPRKIIYDEEIESVNLPSDTDILKNQLSLKNISPPVDRKKMEKAHVSFAKECPLEKNIHNPAAVLPVTKTTIIDSPLTLALSGLQNIKENNGMCKTIEPTEMAYKNQVSEKGLKENNQELPTDKHLLSNLGYIRKQLDIEHQKLKQQVRKTQ